jgi:hypothetical protein
MVSAGGDRAINRYALPFGSAQKIRAADHAPLAPIGATTSPRAILRSTPLSAWVAP